MGADIHGWIEIWDWSEWHAVVDVSILFYRRYALFGSLFGVRNITDFEPVAAGRGLPADVSEQVKEIVDADHKFFHSHTWVTFAELKAVDWNERALDGWAHGYRDGESQWSQGTGLDRSDPRRREGETWIENDMIYRVEAVTRREALGEQGQLVLDVMETLAKRYSEDGVRLVVYFDS